MMKRGEGDVNVAMARFLEADRRCETRGAAATFACWPSLSPVSLNSYAVEKQAK